MHLVDCRKDSAESRRQAYILLLTDEGNRDGSFKDGDIAGVGIVTPERMRRQCVMEGLDAPLNRREQANRKKRILDGEGETRLVRLACSKPLPAIRNGPYRYRGTGGRRRHILGNGAADIRKDSLKPWPAMITGMNATGRPTC